MTYRFSCTVQKYFSYVLQLRDGLARTKLDQNKRPTIEPLNVKKVNEVTRIPKFRNKVLVFLVFGTGRNLQNL